MKITVNNREIEAFADETILSALNRVGIRVPTLCHLADMMPSGACRICVVEVEGYERLLPSCSQPVREGMKIWTNSPRVINARRILIRLLLANHPDDCLYCKKSDTCALRTLAAEYGVRERSPKPSFHSSLNDITSPAIIRNSSKCILCGKCVRVCSEIQQVSAIDFTGRGRQTVIAPAFHIGMNLSSCVNCGQCTLVCPTGALSEHFYLDEIIKAIGDHQKQTVIQYAPSASAAVAEEFGIKPGQNAAWLLNAALRQIGFRYVFDTSFAADMTIMEEAAELVRRFEEGGPFPLFTSCSPAWVKFVEEFYPEFIPNLSTCKSPQGMFGSIIRTCFAKKIGVPPGKIFSVSAMPCTAKKFEATRTELGHSDDPDIDVVITFRELFRMFRLYGIDFNSLQPEPPDSPFGTRSSSGKIFAVAGGVAEAVLRTAHKMLTGHDLKVLKIDSLRGLDGIKEVQLDFGGREISVAAANGLGNARKLLDQIKNGEKPDLKFVEVMACPGGCVGGGGFPSGVPAEKIRARMQTIYQSDQRESLRTAHDNPDVLRFYREYLGEPGSPEALSLLHTSFLKRDVYI